MAERERIRLYTPGIELSTLDRGEQLSELMLWRKELQLAGIEAYEYKRLLDSGYAELLGVAYQVLGIGVFNGGLLKCLVLEGGVWVDRYGLSDQPVSFEEGVRRLKMYLGLL